MTTPIIPQEIYLLERYISLEYFGELRDVWGTLIKHVECCLDDFMCRLPHDYRQRPRPEQPDIVWGERVLPNFRDTYQGLCDGYIKLSRGEVKGLHYAHGPRRGFKGQMDFWAGWMGDEDEETYRELMSVATQKARNICFTEGAQWAPGDLGSDYQEPSRGTLNPSSHWPIYLRVPSVTVTTGVPISKSGIYIPDLDDSCAQFLSTNYDKAPEAKVFVGMEDTFNPATNLKDGEEPIYERRSCIWTLVERVADQGSIAVPPSLLTSKN